MRKTVSRFGRRFFISASAMLAVLTLISCEPVESPTDDFLSTPAPSVELTSAPIASFSPAATPEPTPEPVMPLNPNSTLAPLTWDGAIPEMPDFDVWSYSLNGTKVDYDMAAISANAWGDATYTLEERDDGDLYIVDEEFHGEVYSQFFWMKPTPSQSQSILNYDILFDGGFKGYPEIDTPFEQAISESKEQIDDYLGTDIFTAYPASAPYKDETGYNIRWPQSLGGVPVIENYGIYALYNNYGLYNFELCWLEHSPLDTNAPVTPISFEQALYALNQRRSWVESDEVSFAEEYTVVSEVRAVYTMAFSKNGKALSPAWAFTLVRSNHPNELGDMVMLVDMASGEAYCHSYFFERTPSPYATREASAAYQADYAAKEKFSREYAALFPLEFAQKDGYSYYLTPIEGDTYASRFRAQIWRRNDATGQEFLLDDNARYEGWQDTIPGIRKYMYAALVGERIVFMGYDPDDELDIKRGGHIMSIALDGSDRRMYAPKLHSFSSLCADGDRLYYIGYAPYKEPAPLNYLDPLLTKDRNLCKLDKQLVCVSDGMIYAIDKDGASSEVYMLDGDEWRVYESLPFPAFDVVTLMESGEWLIVGEYGEEYVFAPNE